MFNIIVRTGFADKHEKVIVSIQWDSVLLITTCSDHFSLEIKSYVPKGDSDNAVVIFPSFTLIRWNSAVRNRLEMISLVTQIEKNVSLFEIAGERMLYLLPLRGR